MSYFNPYLPDVVMRSLFLKYDKDNSGYLDMDELKTLFVDDFRLNLKQTEVYAHLLDKDGDSKVSFEEFSTWIRGCEMMKTVDNKSRYSLVQQAVYLFKKYDVDGSQALDRHEFAQLLLDMGGKLEDLDDAMQELDEDGNGRISFPEFLKWLNWVPMNTFA